MERKDARAVQWCRDASAMAGVGWHYIKVPYDRFQGSTATTFAELVAEIQAQGSYKRDLPEGH